MNGLLKINVKHAKQLQRNDLSGVSGKIRLTFGNVGSVSTSLARGKSKESKTINFNENLSWACANVDPAQTKVEIELVSEADQMIARAEDTLDQIITSAHPPSIVMSKNYELFFAKDNTCAGKVSITFTWESHSKASKSSSKKKQSDGGKPVEIEHPQRSIAVSSPEDRTLPQYLHFSFYYLTGKNLLQSRYFSPLINLGESTSNFVLRTMGFKTTNVVSSTSLAVDEQLVPLLDSVDDKVDENIVRVLQALVAGQETLLRTKDQTLTSVSQVTSSTLECAKSAVSSTMDRAQELKDQTFSTVSDLSTATLNRASEVKSKTFGSVSHVTHSTYDKVSGITESTYKTVSGATSYLVSHIPVIGKKVINECA